MPLVLTNPSLKALAPCEVEHPLTLPGSPVIKEKSLTSPFKLITPVTVQAQKFRSSACIETVVVKDESFGFKLIKPALCEAINCDQAHCTRCGKITFWKGDCVIKKSNTATI